MPQIPRTGTFFFLYIQPKKTLSIRSQASGMDAPCLTSSDGMGWSLYSDLQLRKSQLLQISGLRNPLLQIRSGTPIYLSDF
jgi:hypothetical protein